MFYEIDQSVSKTAEITTQDHDDGVSVRAGLSMDGLIHRPVDFMEEMDATGSISRVTKRCYNRARGTLVGVLVERGGAIALQQQP